jgi:hypothetical protein
LIWNRSSPLANVLAENHYKSFMCWTFLCSLSATSVFVSLFWLVFWNFYSRIKNIASRLLHWSCCDETFKIYHEVSISWGRLLEFLQSQKFLDGPKLYRTKIFFLIFLTWKTLFSNDFLWINLVKLMVMQFLLFETVHNTTSKFRWKFPSFVSYICI